MRNLDGIEFTRAIARLRSHSRDLPTEVAICRLEWVLCVAFDDASAVEDAFEAAYGALIDADQTAGRFEAAARDLERAYDGWLAAASALATEIPAAPPNGGAAGRPTAAALPLSATRQEARRKFPADSTAGFSIGRRLGSTETSPPASARGHEQGEIDMSNEHDDTASDPLDGTAYEGIERIEQQIPHRWPGFTKRAKRVREWIHLTVIGIKREHPELSAREVQDRAEQALDELYEDPAAEKVLEQFEATAPSSTAAVRPCRVRPEAEVAAVRWLAPIRWLVDLLLAPTNSRGPAPSLTMVVAVFLQMAFARIRPEIATAHKQLEAGHTMVSWSHDYPELRSYNTVCGSLEEVLHAKPATAMVHVNLELIRRLAEQRDGRGRLEHPQVGRYGIVDAMLVEADVPQVAGADERHREIIRGPQRQMAAPVVYTRGGNISRFCHGYKLLVIVDMATTLPLVWSLIPANGDERREALALVRELFALWPDCPMEALVGDALYDRSKSFAHELVFDWGIQPVFPRAGDYSRQLAHVDTDGIPVCACGEPMQFKDTDGRIYDAAKRAKLGIPRGQSAPELDGRLRWRCRNGRCPSVSTRPLDDPRLYTYYHRGGDHRRDHLRTALLVRRNAVESVFASLKRLGLGGKACDRPSWADDVEMDWLLSAGLLYQTARRFIHEAGAYGAAEGELRGLGLLVQPTLELPAPGPTSDELQVERDARLAALEPPTPPRSWQTPDPD